MALNELSFYAWLLIIVAAFFTGMLHGATGMVGGIVMVAVLGHIIGIKAAITAMTCALILSHSSRAFIYRQDADIWLAGRVLLYATPTLVLGAFIFGYLEQSVIAAIFTVVLILSFPVKYWAMHHQLKTSPAVLGAASVAWGLLAGNVVGPGLFLAPFLLGTGINRLAFVGTLAVITLAMNVIKLLVFGTTELMTWPLFILGVVVGLASIPGNWLGRKLLLLMADNDHQRVVDVLTLLVIGNFIWMALHNG